MMGVADLDFACECARRGIDFRTVICGGAPRLQFYRRGSAFMFVFDTTRHYRVIVDGRHWITALDVESLFDQIDQTYPP